MSDKEEKQKKLQDTLSNYYKISFTDIANIDDPLLIIHDYSPSDSNLNLVSFTFSLLEYYKGRNNIFSEKFWVTHSKVKDPTGSNTPNPNPAYKEFVYGNTFYPFSAKLNNKFNFLDQKSIALLLNSLYSTIDWG